MVVDVHTYAPLRWLMPDYHAGVGPGAELRLDFTLEEHRLPIVIHQGLPPACPARPCRESPRR